MHTPPGLNQEPQVVPALPRLTLNKIMPLQATEALPQLEVVMLKVELCGTATYVHCTVPPEVATEHPLIAAEVRSSAAAGDATTKHAAVARPVAA